jgi:hypothetical protein
MGDGVTADAGGVSNGTVEEENGGKGEEEEQ